MSAKGCCWDNAVEESLFSTLKLELDLDDNREALISPQQLQRGLAFWIEGSYNRERRYSTIGHISPIDYEQQFIAAPALTPVMTPDRCPRNRGNPRPWSPWGGSPEVVSRKR